MPLAYLYDRSTGHRLIADGDRLTLDENIPVFGDAWTIEKVTDVNSQRLHLGDKVQLRAPNNKILWVDTGGDGKPVKLFAGDPPDLRSHGHRYSELTIVSTRHGSDQVRSLDSIGFHIELMGARYLTREDDQFLLRRATGRIVPFRVRVLNLHLCLRSRSGRYLSVDATNAVVARDRETDDPIELTNASRPATGDIAHGNRIDLRFANDRFLRVDGTALRADGVVPGDGLLTVVKADGAGKIEDGDGVRLRLADGRYLTNASGVIGIGSRDSRRAELFTVELSRDLRLLWNGANRDNVTTSNRGAIRQALATGYRDIRSEGRILWSPWPGTVPLKSFHGQSRSDHFLTGTAKGESDALSARYDYLRTEGWSYANPVEGTVPIRSYWNPGRSDNFTSATEIGEKSAAAAEYRLNRIEGHVFLPTPPQSTQPRLRRDVPLTDFSVSRIPAPILARFRGQFAGKIDGSRLRRPVTPKPRRRREPHKRALVLSGGGAKGAFQAGAVQRLWQDFRPDLICGVSVGSVNGAKLAEGDDGAADRLVGVWRRTYPPGGDYRVSRDNYYFDIALKLIESHASGAILEGLLKAVLAFPSGGWSYLHRVFMGGAAERLFNIQTGGIPVSELERKILYTLAHVHSINSMAPLRSLISRELRPDALRIDLRIGLTDLTSGRFVNVTGPLPHWRGEMRRYGLIEPEPDHQLSDDWYTRPPHGADGHAMLLEDAIYASSAQPVFFEPLLAKSSSAPPGEALMRDGDQTYARVDARLPPAVERILRAIPRTIPSADRLDELLRKVHASAANHSIYELEHEAVGDDPDMRHFFDGGLRDTTPIRTAIRHGARDIIVVTGDRPATANWSFAAPGSGGEIFDALPAFQYLMGLLQIWYNDSSRQDLNAAIAHNEFLGWLYRAFSAIDDDARRTQLIREFNQYWAEHGPVLRDALGSTSWLGGDMPFTASESPKGHRSALENIGNPYGVPFHDEGCRIRLVTPDRDIIGALDFENGAQVEEAIALGNEAAAHPLELSHPVREDMIREE